MELKFNNEVIYELTEVQKKVIKNDILEEIFEIDMARRTKYWLEIPCIKVINSTQDKIIEKLKEKNIDSIPTNLVQLGNLFYEQYPLKYRYKFEDILCQVGPWKYTFNKEYIKIYHLMHSTMEKELEEQEYKEYLFDIFKKRMKYILAHKSECCYKRLRKHWCNKLEAEGVKEMTLDVEKFCNQIFSRNDYKNRSEREEDRRLIENQEKLMLRWKQENII